MKHILTDKAGVTILEGIVALGLLALVAGGAFGVLLSASRQTTQPDVKEELAYSLKAAQDLLKVYVGTADGNEVNNTAVPWQKGLCGNEKNDESPLRTGVAHHIECLLPPICDPNNSHFTYTVTADNYTDTYYTDAISESENEDEKPNKEKDLGTRYAISFDIQCGDYRL